MKIVKLFVLALIIFGAVLPVVSMAGELNLTIVNIKENVAVVKYYARYGLEEKANPADYPFYKEIIPVAPVIGTFHGRVKVDVNGAGVFMSVQDVYFDGTVSPYSESSFQMNIPGKVKLGLK